MLIGKKIILVFSQKLFFSFDVVKTVFNTNFKDQAAHFDGAAIFYSHPIFL